MKREAAPREFNGPCAICGRPVTATAKRTPGGVLCCRSVVCDALRHWTAEEWRCRAHVAAHTPPWQRGMRLDVATAGFCLCADEPVPLGTWVIDTHDDGRADLAAACPSCTRVYRQWVDDPNIRDAGSAHRWLDLEALRRHPDPDSYWPEPEPAGSAVTQTIEAVAPVTPIGPVAPPPPPPSPRSLPSPPTPMAAPVRGGVCLVVSCDSKDGWRSRCGRTVHRAKGKVECLPDARMTGWGSMVTCRACLAAPSVTIAA